MQEAQPEKHELHKVTGGFPIKPTEQLEHVPRLFTEEVQALQATLQGRHRVETAE